jgi:hypothetical protein
MFRRLWVSGKLAQALRDAAMQTQMEMTALEGAAQRARGLGDDAGEYPFLSPGKVEGDSAIHLPNAVYRCCAARGAWWLRDGWDGFVPRNPTTFQTSIKRTALWREDVPTFRLFQRE